ncbi:ferric-chelate reductase [Histoplasma capsulatum G186AR]|uniref:Ferric-chelate reductase n=1 Tax=Ajellomyces capsulatus TaxID=5037 RepID=A0A8H7YZ32_AJECA|nr:ferric-chelate reductase [Histoplasma capsulatum]QSS67617.1 ferric-chelate reductase [Histoplasma capsulatum G186AR]
MYIQRLLTPLLILLVPSFLLASDIESTRCILSIAEAVSRLSFTGSLSTPQKSDACTNKLRTYSIYAAATLYCSSTEIEDGLEVLDDDCRKDGLQRIPYDTVQPELTERYLSSLRVVEYGEVSRSVELDEVVVVSRDWYWRVVRTNRAWEFEMWAHHAFGYFSYWFWGIVLLSGILNRLSSYFSGAQWRGIRRDPEGHASIIDYRSSLLFPPSRRMQHWIRTYFIIPAAFGTHHQRLLYWCAIPTRAVAIVVVLFYVLSLIFTCVGHDVFRGNLFWDDIFTQAFRYVSDRTGVMAYANLSLLWLFGSRNNPFLWATGWSFATFNIFHRAIARVATIQAIIHSIGYTVLTLEDGSYSLYWPSPWWYMGVIGTVCMSLLLVSSSIWLRRNYYEIFLIIHITFSLVIICGLFMHTSIFKGKFNLYDRYLWPVVVIWALERFARLARLTSCNLHLRLHKKSIAYTKSVVSYSEASDIIKLEITPGSCNLHPKPGHHYYIYQPVRWQGYESHPLTAGSWTVLGNYVEHYPSAESSVLSSASTSVQSGTGTPIAFKKNITGDLTDAQYKLVFWIRPFNGWTKRLRSECLKSPKQSLTTSFLIEGPYYCAIELHTFENVILIAGGTGIAAALPHIEEHLRRTGSMPSHDTILIAQSSVSSRLPSSPSSSTSLLEPHLPIDPPRTRTSNITFVWTTRQAAFIHEVATRELGPALRRADITTQFYYTASSQSQTYRPSYSIDLRSQQNMTDEGTALLPSFDGIDNKAAIYSDCPTFPMIDIQPGRPDIGNIIMASVREAGDQRTRVRTAVLVCGPAEMADEARMAVHAVLKQGYRDVEYFEESFGW